jgi:hypothetical protein
MKKIARPVPVLIDGCASEGRLVLADGQLAAIIVRLDGFVHDPEMPSRWHLEAGFGNCKVSSSRTPLRDNPGNVASWVQEQLARR